MVFNALIILISLLTSVVILNIQSCILLICRKTPVRKLLSDDLAIGNKFFLFQNAMDKTL